MTNSNVSGNPSVPPASGNRVSVAIRVATVVLVLLGGNQGLAAPPWATTLPQDREALSVLGVATARTLEDAQRGALLNAALQVAEHIEVTVEGSGSQLRTELEQRLTEELKFSSERVPLSKGLVQKWHFEDVPDGHRVFVLVRYPYAEIERTKSNLQAERTERIVRGRGHIRRGETAWDAGRFDEALEAFAGVLEAGSASENRGLEADSRERLIALLASLELLVVSGDGQVADSVQGLRAPLVVRVVSRRNGTVFPLADVPVRFAPEGERSVEIASVLTNEAGEAQVTPGILEAGWHRIKAEVDEAALDVRLGRHAHEEWLRFPNVPAIVFRVKVVPVRRPTRVVILIEESNVGQTLSESIVAQTLSERLQQTGYRVLAEHEIGRTNAERLREALHRDQFWPLSAVLSREADLVVAGTAETRQGSDNMGWAFSTHATVYVRAINLKTGEVVAQKNLSGRVGFGESYERAGIRALDEAGRDVADAVVDQLVLRDEGATDAER